MGWGRESSNKILVLTTAKMFPSFLNTIHSYVNTITATRVSKHLPLRVYSILNYCVSNYLTIFRPFMSSTHLYFALYLSTKTVPDRYPHVYARLYGATYMTLLHRYVICCSCLFGNMSCNNDVLVSSRTAQLGQQAEQPCWTVPLHVGSTHVGYERGGRSPGHDRLARTCCK